MNYKSTSMMMTIDEALKSVIYNHDLHGQFGVKESTVRSWRKKFEEGKLPTDKKKEILEKTGMVIVQPEMWSAAIAPIKKPSRATIKELNEGILKGAITRKLAGEK